VVSPGGMDSRREDHVGGDRSPDCVVFAARIAEHEHIGPAHDDTRGVESRRAAAAQVHWRGPASDALICVKPLRYPRNGLPPGAIVRA
jgi:hypothetical protein